ncbi:MAG: hypothetical protein DRP96_03005 [Candidatus Neomarinimicrobiota bacterium]|nr:MAG: hypothetical protein DRP96_03005 [Candidatus Neomarinimicrobiota bacterium]
MMNRKLKKIYISCDMEGINGVCSDRHREMGNLFYEWARQQTTRELSTVISEFKKRGVEEFVVNDSHDYMLNLHIDELPEGTSLISGTHKTDSMMEGVDAGFDGAVFIGYHGRCGLHRAVLSHTYSDSIYHAEINGIWFGETTINAAYCGEKDIPVLLVSGDDVLADEVRRLATGTKSVITKYGISRSAGRMLHPAQVTGHYQKAVEEVCQSEIKPFRLESPYHLAITLREPQMVDIALRVPGTVRTGESSLEFSHNDYITTYRAFLAIQTLASGSYLK